MLSHASRLRARGAVVLSLFVLAVNVAACGGSAPAASFAPAANPPDAAGNAQGNGGGDNTGNGGNGSDSSGSGGGNVAQAAPLDLLIIKTGTIAVQVEDLDAAIATATQQVKARGGYTSGSERAGDGDNARASMTFRIPASSWEDVLAGFRTLGVKVLDERSSTEEVTGQVVDLAARIKNLQATEAAVQGIMTRATEIDDILQVQSELTQIRGQIEQLAAQKSHLEEQAAFSTITVTFSLKPVPLVVERPGFDPATEVDAAMGSLTGMLEQVTKAGIWFVIVWVPVLLVVGLIAGGGAWVYGRSRRDATGGGGPVAPTAASGA
jgi:hypothetical protein